MKSKRCLAHETAARHTHFALGLCSPFSLPTEAVEFNNDRDNELFFSSASIWEMGIKNAMGKANFQFDPAVLRRALLDAGYK